jgi:Zn-finger nucleic acid-binding protein
MSVGVGAAAAAVMAQGFANARKFQVDREKQKIKRKERQAEIKEKYSSRLSKFEIELVEAINSQIVKSDLPESSKLCPECHKKFSIIELMNIEVDCCVRCHSFWFDSGELMEFHGLESDAPSSNLKSRASKYKCPVCSEKMREVVFQAPHNLLLDQCDDHGVYLENGELNRVVEIS